MIGKRITNPAATGTTISGLVSGVQYRIEVVSYSEVGKTFPVIDASIDADIIPPVVTSSVPGGNYSVPQQVTLTSNELGSEIWFTTDGSAPIVGGPTSATATPGTTAQHFTGPITISDPTKPTVLKVAAFDPSGNVSATVTVTYTISNDPVPAATSFTTSAVGLNQVTLNWNAADPGLPLHSITDYQVDVFSNAAATTLVTSVNTGAATTKTITGLPANTSLWFTVKAKNDLNPAYGPASAVLGPLTPQGVLVAIAGVDQTGVVRGSTVNLTGFGSTPDAAFTWTQVGNTPADAVQLTAPNAQDTSFQMPFFQAGMSNTLTFQLSAKVGNDTQIDTVTITAKSDVVSITTAKWKPGDFRVVGVSSPGSIVTIRTAVGGTIYGTPVVADATGAFDFRLRTGVPNIKPAAIVADSNLGGSSTPFNVAG
jgi:hypothetical protein